MTQVLTCQPESRANGAAVLPISDLVTRAQAGSRPAFVEIVARFQGRVYNFLLRRTASRADAEDLTLTARANRRGRRRGVGVEVRRADRHDGHGGARQ